jgi:hypothetical protein
MSSSTLTLMCSRTSAMIAASSAVLRLERRDRPTVPVPQGSKQARHRGDDVDVVDAEAGR